MSDQLNSVSTPTLMGRIGSLFRRTNRIEELTTEGLPALIDPAISAPTEPAEPAPADQIEPRTTFLRPWSRREQTIEQLQNGVTALSDLMGSIRDNLQQQNTQHGKLAEVLECIHRADGQQRRSLDAIQERVDAMGVHEEAISRSLTTVGTALEMVSRNSETSAQVLCQIRENLGSRDSDLERVISKQNTRFTTMLTVAIVMSMAALTAVVVFGYLGYQTLSHVK
ncbi:MAG TPA: hypothetical protein VFC78_10900 [Tepidisphaeraceae bacterium]|nr:hypothetical protein [Tepidisphaeraceae bacterium]